MKTLLFLIVLAAVAVMVTGCHKDPAPAPVTAKKSCPAPVVKTKSAVAVPDAK